jgi:HSP20 family molecular chaperone IbpA
MDEPDCPPEGKDHRIMVEDITVTPFFSRHGGHKAMSLKLHAEVKLSDKEVILESELCGYDEDDVEVSATPNTFDVTLFLDGEGGERIPFHSSYLTPEPIDEKKVSSEYKDGLLKIKAPLRE